MKLEELGRKVKKFSRDTVAEVQRMNEVRQFNARIHEEKKLLNSVYMEIGKKLYQQYKDAPLEGFQDEFHRIEERFTAIEVYADQVRKIRGVRLCPNCNTEVSVTEKFCSNCGSKLPEIITIEDTEQDVEGLSEKEAPEETGETVVDADEKDIRTETEAESEAPEETGAKAEAEMQEEAEAEAEAEAPEETEAKAEAEVQEETEAELEAEAEASSESEAEGGSEPEEESEAVARAADAAGAAAAFQEQIKENTEDVTDKTPEI